MQVAFCRTPSPLTLGPSMLCVEALGKGIAAGASIGIQTYLIACVDPFNHTILIINLPIEYVPTCVVSQTPFRGVIKV